MLPSIMLLFPEDLVRYIVHQIPFQNQFVDKKSSHFWSKYVSEVNKIYTKEFAFVYTCNSNQVWNWTTNLTLVECND